jgi:hypothetical protein
MQNGAPTALQRAGSMLAVIEAFLSRMPGDRITAHSQAAERGVRIAKTLGHHCGGSLPETRSATRAAPDLLP